MARTDAIAVGLDFGTSTSFISRAGGTAEAEILPLGNSRRFLASVAGHLGGAFVVGEEAELLTPDRLIRSIKSAITHGRDVVRVGGRDGTTEVRRDDVIVAILREIAKRTHERGWLSRGDRLRLGCPAMWLGAQRRLLVDLARMAGLPVHDVDLVEEPVAAGIAWLNGKLRTGSYPAGRVLVFDMGGGTLDLAVMQVDVLDRPRIAVLTSVGLALAGDVLDEAIVDDLCAERGLDLDALALPLHARADLLNQAREAKVLLSNAQSQSVYFDPAYYGGRVPPVRYTRERLEAAFQPQMAEAEKLIWQALKLARLTSAGGTPPAQILSSPLADLAHDVDVVLLVGGMSRVPYVRARLAELLPYARLETAGIPSDEAVVTGLAGDDGYNTMNMYRPDIDVELAWPGGESLRLYDAFTPLFDLWQLQSGQSLLGRAVSAGRREGIPRQREGELRVRTSAGVPVELVHTQRTARPVPTTSRTLAVPFGLHDIHFKLYCDGHIHLTDGAGHDHHVRLSGWPVIGESDTPGRPDDDAQVPYPFNHP